MTPTALADALRHHVDSVAPPLSIDEITDLADDRWTTELHVATLGAEERGRRPADLRPRAAWLAVAAAIVGVGAWSVAALTPDGSAPVDGAAGAGSAVDAPEWYTAIAAILPEGFGHLAATESNEWFVRFESFDPATGRNLGFVASRVPIEPDPGGAITLDEALATPSGQPLARLDVSLPDGRQVDAVCSIGHTVCPDDGPGALPRSELDAFVLRLATTVLDPSVLPPLEPAPDRVTGDRIRAAVQAALGPADPELTEIYALDEAPSAVTFVGYSTLPPGIRDDGQGFTVRAVAGFRPALPSSDVSSVSADGVTTSWRVDADGVLWTVTDPIGMSPSFATDLLTSVDAPG